MSFAEIFRSPLCFAVERVTSKTRNAYIAVIKLLLEYGAEPNASAMEAFFDDSDIDDCFLVKGLDRFCIKLPYIYPMQTAVKSGDMEILKLLLGHGASLAPPYGVPLLVVAVLESHPHMLDFLLQLGACPNAIGMEGEYWSPIVEAILENDGRGLAAVQRLLTACADPDLPSSVHDGVCPLQTAAATGNRQIFDALLLGGAELSESDSDIDINQTIFINFVKHKWHDLMEVALEDWADADATDNEGVPVLVKAIENADLVAIELLLREGANVHAYAPKSTFIFTHEVRLAPIQLAAFYGYFDVVSLLLNWGARIDQEPSPEDGLTTLHSAVYMKRMDMAMYLLSQGVPVNATCQVQVRLDELGRDMWPVEAKCVHLTSLWVAVMMKNVAMVQMLLEHGADPNFPLSVDCADLKSLTMLDHACRQTRTMIELLGYHGGSLTDPFEDDNTFLLSAIFNKDIEWALELLTAGTPINGRSRIFRHTTALQAACSNNDLHLINYLLESGANVNVPFSEYQSLDTPLQYAAARGQVDLVKTLIAFGADVNASPRPTRGETALQAAASKGYLRIAQILLDHGADICAPAPRYYGQTAIEGAVMYGRVQMVQLLLDKYHGPKPVKLLLEAYEAAETHKQWHIIDMLESYQRPRD